MSSHTPVNEPKQMGESQELVNIILKKLTELEGEIAPILVSSIPTEGESDTKNEESRIIADLRSISRRISEIYNRIHL